MSKSNGIIRNSYLYVNDIDSCFFMSMSVLLKIDINLKVIKSHCLRLLSYEYAFFTLKNIRFIWLLLKKQYLCSRK